MRPRPNGTTVDPQPLYNMAHAHATHLRLKRLVAQREPTVWGRAGEPTVRILLRYSLATGASAQAASSGSRPALPGGDNLATIMAQTIVQALGGSFTSDTTDADECVVIIDLPAPGPE